MKKIALFVAVITLLFCFTGCGKKDNNLKINEIELTKETFAFAIKKDNEEFKSFVNNFIYEMNESGELDSIINSNFSGSNNFKYHNPKSEKDCFIVATEASFPPFEYVDGNSFAGIDIEIAFKMAEKLNKTLFVKNMAFESLIQDVKNGDSHIVMAGLTVNPVRLESVDFSNGYYQSTQVLITQENDKTFNDCKSADDIVNILNNQRKGYILGAQRGTTGFMYITENGNHGKGFSNIHANVYTTGALAIKDLANGKINGVIIDKKPGTSIVENLYSGRSALEIFYQKFISEKGYLIMFTGLKNTILIAVFGLIIGFLLGVIVVTVKILPGNGVFTKILKGITTAYIAFLRGTPLLVQLLLCHFAIFPALNIKIHYLLEAILVYGLNSSAYLSETLRSGIQSIDKGQMEAGRALGFSFSQTMFKIILPQAIKNILPSLGNEFISLIKETSVVNLIAVTDLTRAFTAIAESTYEYFIPYIMLAFIYLVIVLVITFIIKITEGRFAKNER